VGNQYLELLAIFLVVAGPTKAIAMLAAGTGHLDWPARRAIVIRAVAASSIVLIAFALLGQQIVAMFHVSVAALEIAGGIILFVFALHLVLGETHEPEAKAGGDISLYPLAVPMLATPQAIVAIIAVTARQTDLAERTLSLAALGTVMVVNLVVLLAIARSMRGGGDEVGKSSGASEVILRIVAILLCGLAVELVLLGLRDLGVLEAAAAGH
jgi:multiple antibiotic resistance protein